MAEEDVADTTVLGDLRTALEEAKSIPSLTGLEMGDTLEEIRQQGQSLSEQTDKIKGLYDELRSAASQVEESQRAKRAEYGTMSVFDAAKAMGYAVTESPVNLGRDYYVCFMYDGASFLIRSGHEPTGNILFYGKEIDQRGFAMGPFIFTSFFFTDGDDAARDSQGHWTFSAEQKEQLLDLLLAFKKRGPSSFLDVLTSVSSGDLSPEMRAVVQEFDLKAAYQKVAGSYRFMVSDGKSLALFTAVYPEADFRPSGAVPAEQQHDPGQDGDLDRDPGRNGGL